MLELEPLAVVLDRHGFRPLGDDHVRHGDRQRVRLRGAVVQRMLLDGRVARGERLGQLLVERSSVVDAEGLERTEEGALGLGERHAVLRAARAGEAGLDVAEVELHHLRVGRVVLGVVPEQVLLAVGLDERDSLLFSSREAEVFERDLVDGEEAARRAVLGRHVPDRRPVGERQVGDAGAEVLHELPDDAGLAEDLGHGEDEVRRRRSLAQRAAEPEADHLRDEHRDRLAEHRGLGFDPADTPAEHAEPVDHRRVRVGAEQRVRIGLTVARLDDAAEVLEVDLVDDPGLRGDDLEVVERLLAPAEEGVALAVPLVLAIRVDAHRHAVREGVDLDRVVDHELGGELWIRLRRVAAEVVHRVAHGGEVDDRGHAGEVLVDHARRREGDLPRGIVLRDPLRDRLDVLLGRGAEDVLEQDLQRVRQPLDVEALLERRQPEDLVALAPDVERRASSESVPGHQGRS